MMSFPTHIFFLGIGGIGMSALARFFLDQGHRVYGYDRSETSLCQQLVSEGATVIYSDADLPAAWQSPFSGNAMVVRTPAVRDDNSILMQLRNYGYPVLKRSEMLGRITSAMHCLAVAGTHGKTTTSAMLAHLFYHSNRKIYAFLGGVSTNYNTNYLKGEEDMVVVEADEYDRSFLKLSPNNGIITNTDSDHLDIYESPKAMLEVFEEFAAKVRSKGRLLVRYGIPIRCDYTYSVEHKEASFFADNIEIINGLYHFDIVHKKITIKGIKLALPGLHNVENALGAAALAFLNDLNPKQIREGLNSFRGVHRRFAWHFRTGVNALIDDYAHHPTELNALISTVKALYPDQRFALLFQPHLYSRTRDFADDFAQALDAVDFPALLPVYAARETPDCGIDSTALKHRMRNFNAKCIESEGIESWLYDNEPDVIVTAGAGDIDQYLPVVMKYLQNKPKP